MSDPTRSAAFDLLTVVLDQRRTLEDALDALPTIAPRDRAAAHRLAAAVLRRLGSLDAAIEPYLKKAPPDPVRHILRLGAAGLLLLDAPPHAAVTTAVELAKSRRLVPFAPLVNAVLRRIAQAGVSALEGLDGPRLDTPSWLWSTWGSEARVIALAHLHEAPVDLTLSPGCPPPAGGEELPTGSWRYPAGTRVTELAGFAAGGFWVQDAAAALPAMLLAVRPGERVADLCAAPGGKTAQLASTGAAVTAVERDGARMARLRENLVRLKLQAETVVADVVDWLAPGKFDAVLLDAPCSATGTIRRHPDVAYLKRPRDVAALAERQERLLDAAAAMLRPGGRLIYAVCSLQGEEGAELVRRSTLRPMPFTAQDCMLPEALTLEGWLRTTPALWPERGGMDGFFIARLQRV